MRLAEVIALGGAADFMGPSGIAVSMPTRTAKHMDREKRIGDKRAEEFQADSSTASTAPFLESPRLAMERLRWETEGAGRSPVFGKPPYKCKCGAVRSNS